MRRLLTALALAPCLACALWLYLTPGVDLRYALGFALSLLARPAPLAAPPGVAAAEWATGLTRPTSLTFGPDGRLYVSQLSGEVIALADSDGDGLAETHTTYASGFSTPLGLAFHGDDLYVGRREGVDLLRDRDGDGVADETLSVLAGLPAGRHQTNGLAFGPDGRLYVATGSRSDRGETPIDPLEASILVVDAACLQPPNDCAEPAQVYASGLRNPYDLAFHPASGALFAADNGRDVPASGVADELNVIVEGGRYGWPGCWGSGQGEACEGTRDPVALFEERASADGLAFYTGRMFPQWEGDLFVALYGANSGDPGIGRKVQRVELAQDAAGDWSATVHDFASGFDRPLDVAVGPDGALYVADLGRGVIYRLVAE